MNHIRSLLMVPAHRRRCLDKCLSLGADALVFDLEDSVPVDKKSEALEVLTGWLSDNIPQVPTWVRVNPSRMDLEVGLLEDKVTGIMIPKVKTMGDVPYYDLPLLLVIETARAICELESLLSDTSVVGAVFGVGDYSADMGVIDRPWTHHPNNRFAYAKQKLATVARAYEKQAFDTSFYVKGQSATLETRLQWQTSAAWGFTGASPIHPMQVPVANQVFSPSSREVEWSAGTIAGTSANQGEVWVDGEGFVVGPPHVRQAIGKLDGHHRSRDTEDANVGNDDV